MDSITDKIYATEKDVDRARVLESLGFKAMDALHLACAERLHVVGSRRNNRVFAAL